MSHYTQQQEMDVDKALGLFERLVVAAESIAESLDAFNGMQSALINRYDGEPDPEETT
jgi:hypothetical protein